MNQKTALLLWGALFVFQSSMLAEDGYRLWLRYDKISDDPTRLAYMEHLGQIVLTDDAPLLTTAAQELSMGLSGLLGQPVPFGKDISQKRSLILHIAGKAFPGEEPISQVEKKALQEEGFILRQINRHGEKHFLILGKDEKGVLYGSFRFLQLLQRHQPLEGLHVSEHPKVQHRILNHWDNLDRTVERGYAGFSIWDWHQLPEFLYPQYTDYARANASIGINGAVVTNVNANALIFRPDYLQKAAALADVFRPYGIKLYLTARFSAPIELGGLPSADPLDAQVQQWWKQKVEEIYQYIPDFGGFLVKANSEGQPGPQDYGRSHADGANLLADALAPHGGIVMWRAFVYSNDVPEDRSKQAYNEFVPLDGSFRANVLIQVKNGPIDFQPREPIHPLFGAMPQTPVMMEFQIPKEYLGQGTHLVGLASLYEEVLQTDTYIKGKGSTVARVIDGSLHGYELTGMAGVSNIGTARNWTGHLFGQADCYAFGRLAWDPHLRAAPIFEEWAALTFGLEPLVVQTVSQMLQDSYEASVRYMTPLGLHHIMGPGHHYGPGPWGKEMPRADWTSVYYHKAEEGGIGFDRSAKGSDALSQYHPDFSRQFADPKRGPLPFLLWFHQLPWDYPLATGRDVWEELCWQYQRGTEEASALKKEWETLQPYIDAARFQQVLMHLEIQEKHHVIITGRNEEKLQAAVEELGEGCQGIAFDMANLGQIPDFVQNLVQSSGSIDILVNNAGINQKKSFLEVTDEDYERIIRVNQTAVFALSREVAKVMLGQAEKGVIVHISSMAAHYGLPQIIAYTSSKAALEGMTAAMAVELTPMGIRVNCVAPGFIRTAMSSKALDNDPVRLQKVLSRTPAGRLGVTSDVADAVFFLASDQAQFITGVVLRVDGGNAIGF